MTAYILDWLSLLFRWGHVLAGIAWVGGSFLYVWIDNNLEKPPQWKEDKGILGDVWVIHGGGIYEFQKYKLAPPVMPAILHWVKWESYFTWLTGILLLCFIYYGSAESYLMTSESIFSSPWQAVLASIFLLSANTAIYESLIRTPLVNRGPVFAAAMTGYFLLFSFVAMELFAPRAAAIHLGIAIGSIMTGNVFFGIMPSQRAFVSAIENGQTPDASRAAFAKLRSTHNNYLTLPVLMCMISNHYPMLYSHANGWVILVVVGAISAYARHFFNLKNRGVTKPHILVIAALAMASVAFYMRPAAPAAANVDALSIEAVAELKQEGQTIVQTHCAACHASRPEHPAFNAPPAGVVLESEKQIAGHTDKIRAAAVQSTYMPLGNVTGMTEQERRSLDAYLSLLR